MIQFLPNNKAFMIVGAVALVSVFVFIVAFMALLLVGAARIFTLPLNYPATVTVVGIAFSTLR